MAGYGRRYYRVAWGRGSEGVMAGERRGRGRPPLPELRLTEPEVVPITEQRYQQVVDLLAAMILDYYYAAYLIVGSSGASPAAPALPD